MAFGDCRGGDNSIQYEGRSYCTVAANCGCMIDINRDRGVEVEDVGAIFIFGHARSEGCGDCVCAVGDCGC